MKKGDWVNTPRFCKVKIENIYKNKQTAYANGFTEPTYYDGVDHDVFGKSLDMYHMIFAAVEK